MSVTALAPSVADRVGAAVADGGWAVVTDFLPVAVIAALRADAMRCDTAGKFHPAGVGRGNARIERADIRGDRILWIDETGANAATRPLWAALSTLRLALNQALYLGLFSFEGHYSIYPPDASYARHRDRFCNDDARVLSCVLYLNKGWRATDGGALRLFVDGDKPRDIQPVGGTFVCFLAERFEHEVLPAMRERLALTGWFRRRAW